MSELLHFAFTFFDCNAESMAELNESELKECQW
jgi:hypothetical protein